MESHGIACVTCVWEDGQRPMVREKTQKRALFFFLRTERKVRIALHAIRYQIALDWTADEIIAKNNKYTIWVIP